MKKIYYLSIALFFAACQAEPEIIEEVSPLIRTRASELQFAGSDNVNLTELGIIHPTKIVRKDSLYLILTPHSKYRFAVYNHITGAIRRLVPAGSGEGGGISFLNLHLDGSVVSSLDFSLGRLVEIDLSQCFTDGYQPTMTDLTAGNKTPLGAIRVNDRIISTGIYTAGRYCTTTPEDGADNYSVDYPECADAIPNDTLKSIFYASNCLASHPSGSRLACANMQYGCLDLCDIDGDELHRFNEVHLNRPGVVFRSKRPRGNRIWHPVAYTRNNLFGFCDLTVSEDYIYALYSGRTYKTYQSDVDKGRTILVFDWNGTHVRTYHLSNSCSSITYDEESGAIYALSHEQGQSEIITLNL